MGHICKRVHIWTEGRQKMLYWMCIFTCSMNLTRDNVKALTLKHWKQFCSFCEFQIPSQWMMDFVHLTSSTPGQWNLPDVTYPGHLSLEGKSCICTTRNMYGNAFMCSTSCLFLCLFLRIEKAWYFPGIVTVLHLRISKHFRKSKINPHSVCIFCVSFITDSLQYCHIAHTENQLGGGKVKQGPDIQYPNFTFRNLRLIYKQFLWTGLKVPGPSWKGSVLVSSYYTVKWSVETTNIIFYPVKIYGIVGAEPMECSYCPVDKTILVTRLIGPTPLSI